MMDIALRTQMNPANRTTNGCEKPSKAPRGHDAMCDL
jgi:hypothetical protein